MKLQLSLLLLALFALSACNTARGIGADIQAGGKAVEEVADETQKAIKTY